MKKALTITVSCMAIAALLIFSSSPKLDSNKDEITLSHQAIEALDEFGQERVPSEPAALPKLTATVTAQSETAIEAVSELAESDQSLMPTDRWVGAELIDARTLPSSTVGIAKRIEVLKHPELQHPIRVEALISNNGGQPIILQETAADHIIIKVKEGIDQANLSRRLGEMGLEIGEKISDFGLYTIVTPELTVDAAQDLRSKLEDLAVSDLVEYSSYDYMRRLAVVPNDSAFERSILWGLDSIPGESGVDADIDAPQGWDIRTDASDIIVSVLDTGILYTHEDLVGNMWTNNGEIAGNGIDDDANGYIDDVYGVDTIYAANRVEAGDPEDLDGHGTHVAGTIGASSNNVIGVTGVAWDVQLMAIRSIHSIGGLDKDLIEGIDYSVANGATIINASLGGPGYNQALYESIARAEGAGVAMVVAAGNEGTETGTFYKTYPSDFDLPNIVSVASHGREGQLSVFSNYSEEHVDISAPGEDILSTSIYPDPKYVENSGTSMATPVVSGIAALVAAQYPGEDYSILIERILQGGENNEGLPYKVRTNARANLPGALADRALKPSTPFEVALSTIGDTVILKWNHLWAGELVGYKILRKTDDGEFQEIGASPAGTRRFEDLPIDFKREYEYRIVAYNQAGDSLPSIALKLNERTGVEASLLVGSFLELPSNGFGEFGLAMDSEGDVLAVSAHEDWDNDSEAGAVIIYGRYHGGQWIERQKLTATDGSAYHHFGNAISLDGNTLAVGAYHYDGLGIDTGTVYLFERNANGLWVQQQVLEASDASERDRFGYTISLDGDSLAIAARDDSPNGLFSGSVYVYTRDSNGQWGNEAKIYPEDGAERGYFGWSISLDGDRLAIGARGDATNGPQSGAVYVYGRDSISGTWSQEDKVLASNPAPYDLFGHVVALEGNDLVVGAPSHDTDGIINNGVAYAYRYENGAWGGEQQLQVTDAQEAFFQFGYSLDIADGRLLVGSNSGFFSVGGSYLYSKSQEGTWSKSLEYGFFTKETQDDLFGSQLIIDPAAPEILGLGASLSLGEDYVVMGTPRGTSVYTSINRPSAVGEFWVDAIDFNGVSLRWTDTSDSEEGFIIQRSASESGGTALPWEEIASLGPNTTAYVDTDVYGGVEWNYRIVVVGEFVSEFVEVGTRELSPSTIANISAQSFTGTGDQLLRVGLIVESQRGEDSMDLLVRARGDSLGIPGTLADPRLDIDVYDLLEILPEEEELEPIEYFGTSDNWSDVYSNDWMIFLEQSARAPTIVGYPNESVFVDRFETGFLYDCVVSGIGNTSGIANVEAYPLSSFGARPFISVSAQALITPSNPEIKGTFTLEGVNAMRVAFLGLGRSLNDSSFYAIKTNAQTLPDPILTVRDSGGAIVAQNDSWLNAELREESFFTFSDRELIENFSVDDAAIFVVLKPGTYTFTVSGSTPEQSGVAGLVGPILWP